MNEMEQYSRRECLEIRGIPVSNDEDTNGLVRKVGDLIDVDIKSEYMYVSHRLPAFKSRNAAENNQRDALYKARSSVNDKSTSDIGFTRQHPHKLFILESLTRKNRLLFDQCLKKK